MNTTENMTEVDKLRALREQAREQHIAAVQARLGEADKALEAAIVALGHECSRHQHKHYDYETKVETVEIGSLEYIDHIYFGSDWGFYEQGSSESSFEYKPGNGKLSFRYRDPIDRETKIIRERKSFPGGFDFTGLAKMLVDLAAPCIPAALEKKAEQDRQDAENKAIEARRKAAEDFGKETKAALNDDRLESFHISAESWGRSERLEISFIVKDLETAKAIVRDYFLKQ